MRENRTIFYRNYRGSVAKMSGDLARKVSDVRIDDAEAGKTNGEADEDVVNPWTVSSSCDTGIDYNKLLST